MRAGRNDPCPCGSGRKYKHCCQRVDIEADAPATTGTTRRHVLEVAARETTWEADAVPIAVGIEDGARHRPVAILIAAAELVIGSTMRDRLSGEPDALAEAFEREISAAAREVGSFPERLVIRYPELREPLQARLEPRGIRVEVAAQLESEPAARGLVEHMTGISQWPPVSIADSWSAWRVPAATIRELFAAAAEFWRRAPWKVMDDEQMSEAVFPSGRVWTVSVMGNAGVQMGLSLYSESDDVFAIATARDPEDAAEAITGRVISLTYSAQSEVAAGMRIEAQSSGWEIADRKAFPLLMTINTPGGGVTRQQIEELTALLRAIPEFAETHAEDLVLERESGVPAVPLRWDSADGLTLTYDGEAAMARLDAAGGLDDALEPGLEIDPAHKAELRRVAEQIMEEMGPDVDAATFVRAVAERSGDLLHRMAETPQHEFGGLSSRQLGELIDADWSEKEQAVVLNPALPFDRLSNATLALQCRTLLSRVAERGGIRTTQNRYLATAAVRELADEFGGAPDQYPDGTARRVTERDVTPLHVSRILLEISGALAVKKGRFVVTPLGKRLLHEDLAGELFSRLFIACFQRFDLTYLGGPEWPELESEVAYTLYRLTRRPAEWATPEELLPEVVLASTILDSPFSDLESFPAVLLEMRILRVLVEFGLLEREPRPDGLDEPVWRRYRATPLLRDFISFRV